MAQEPEQDRKIFIGGLSYKTSEEGLRGFYSQWGELLDAVVMTDKATGNSRGFGFVTYSHPGMVDDALRNRSVWLLKSWAPVHGGRHTKVNSF